MENNKKTPCQDGASNQPLTKSESCSHYTKSSLTYKELCASVKPISKEIYNDK